MAHGNALKLGLRTDSDGCFLSERRGLPQERLKTAFLNWPCKSRLKFYIAVYATSKTQRFCSLHLLRLSSAFEIELVERVSLSDKIKYQNKFGRRHMALQNYAISAGYSDGIHEYFTPSKPVTEESPKQYAAIRQHVWAYSFM